MCCFSNVSPSGPKLQVSGTNIFARVAGGMQWLVYAMSLETPSDVAMVLPLPVGKVADDALTFIDLSGCPELFGKLAELFVPHMPVAGFPLSRGGAPQAQTLVVHQVGAFEASYVPTLADMTRLDRRFRIPDEVWSQRPVYADYGFAVFKLKKSKKQNIHPMAMLFPTRQPGSLFFPTVHVHDGELHETAAFDHKLYFQTGATFANTVAAMEALYPVAMHVPLADTKGIVDGMSRTFRLRLDGTLPNDDTRIALD